MFDARMSVRIRNKTHEKERKPKPEQQGLDNEYIVLPDSDVPGSFLKKSFSKGNILKTVKNTTGPSLDTPY